MDEEKPLKKFEEMSIGDLTKIHDSFEQLIIVRNNFKISSETITKSVENMDNILEEVSETLTGIKVNLE